MPAPVATRRARLQMPFAMQALSVSNDPLNIQDIRLYITSSGAFLKLSTQGGVAGWGAMPGGIAGDLGATNLVLRGKPVSAYEAVELSLKPFPRIACAAVTAMLDCLGKHTKAPVYQVLGGPTRHKVRVMASTSHPTQIGEIRAARAAGHRAFSLDIPAPPFPNSGKLYVNRIRALVDEARAAAGEGCDFVLSANAQLTAGDAQQLAAEFERTHLLWLDEPCRHGNTSALRKISDESVTPIGLGRDCRDAADFQDLLREEAADILRPSLNHFSLSRARKIAALAETYYIAVAPTYSGGTLATAAALHLAASIPNFFITHLPRPAPDDPVKGLDLTVRDGYLNLPTAPGLGITVDEAALARMEVRA